jgi:lysosomal acid lipase/cholesteryl ester hydrolase
MSRIHDAALFSSQLLLALSPLLILVSTLLAMSIGLSTANHSTQPTKKRRAHDLRNALDFTELCAVFGYRAEEHVVTTPDGYRLLLHRILRPATHADSHTPLPRPVVFFQHGLLTNSEFFVVLTDAHRCLPFVLLDNGYDVWLGNNR